MTTLVITLALAGIASVAHAMPPSDIRAYCSVHPGDQSRRMCEQGERDAKERLYRQADLPRGIPPDVWYYCGTVYSSWRDMELCARDELRSRGLLAQ
jgi:hypothetical protein